MWFFSSGLVLLLPNLSLMCAAAYSPLPASEGLNTSSLSSSQQWSELLQKGLWFYNAQRSGQLTDGSGGERIEWRNDSGLADGSDVGVDLVGGYVIWASCSSLMPGVVSRNLWGEERSI